MADAKTGKVVLLERGVEREVSDLSWDPNSSVRCPGCKGRHGLADLLANAVWDGDIDVVSAPCPAAHGPVELRLSEGGVEFGYVYAAGTRHFAAMEQTVVPGLTVARAGPDLSVGLLGGMLRVPAVKR